MKSLGKPAAGLRLERMRDSALWNGGGFRNPHPPVPGLRDLSAPRPTLRDFLRPGGRRVPSGPLPALDPRENWRRPAADGLRATWLGHSTVLLELDGLRVLTDPVWGARASPLPGLGPRRFQPVPVALRQLPPLDLVLVSCPVNAWHFVRVPAGAIGGWAQGVQTGRLAPLRTGGEGPAGAEPCGLSRIGAHAALRPRGQAPSLAPHPRLACAPIRLSEMTGIYGTGH